MAEHEVPAASLTRGTAWGLVQTAVQKGCGVGTYLGMTYLLDPADLGAASLAIAIVATMTVLYPGAAGDILIQRSGERDPRLIPATGRLAFLAGLGTFLVVVLGRQLIAGWWKDPALAILLVLAASRVVLDAVATVPLSSARARLEFRYLSLLETVSSVLTLGLTLLAAWQGYGAKAILLPIVAVGAVRLLLLWWHQPWHIWGAAEGIWRRVRELWGDFREGGFQHYLNGVSQTIDYLALSFFHIDAVLGVYTIAYQLASLIGIGLSFTVGSVLQPILVQLGEDRHERVRTYIAAQRGAMAAAAGAGLAMVAVGACAIQTLLPDRWHAAAGPLTILALAFVVGNPIQLARAKLRAVGRFRAALVLQIITTAMLGTLVVAGSYWGGANAVALGVMVTFGAMAPAHLLVSLRTPEERREALPAVLVRPPLCALIAFSPALMLSALIRAGEVPVLPSASVVSLAALGVVTVGSVAIYLALLARWEPEVYGSAQRLASRIGIRLPESRHGAGSH